MLTNQELKYWELEHYHLKCFFFISKFPFSINLDNMDYVQKRFFDLRMGEMFVTVKNILILLI